jgi:NCS1 family nucleobase:cation symporter-1
VFFGTIIGSLFIYLFSNWIGEPSQKFGLPFVVLLRSSLGVKGAKYFGLLRTIVGIFMFGIQTYFLSKALVYLIRIAIFTLDPSILDTDIFLTFFLGLNTIDWISITLSIVFQVFLFSAGMIFNRRLIKFSAIMVYLGIFIFFLAVLLNDVKISSTAFINSLNYQNTFDQKNFLPLLTVAGTVFAYFSIIILSFGDFSRYVKNENELKKGNLSLLLNLIIFSFFSLFIVIGADTILKQDPENLSIILTNPTDIIGKFNNLLITNLALIFIIIASASTNLIANFIPSQYALINFIPSSISLKRASFIIGFLGFFIGVFWLTLLSQIGILSIIDTLGAFFGPLFGLMISDFYFIQKSKLNNKDIYSLDKEGVYYYSAGWHLKGVYSLILGFIFAASTIWNSNLMFLQSYSWIIGALVTAIVYYLLAKD